MPRRTSLVMPFALAASLALALALMAETGPANVDVAAAASAEQCFPQTGKCVSGRFYDYWLANGGLAQQGYPISDEFDEVNPTDGKTYRTQYFERARFEHHPEYAGTAYEVLLGLLGREQHEAKYGGAPVAELIGQSYATRGILGEPLTVRVTDARRTGGIPAGGGGSGATAPVGEVFVVIFYTVTNMGGQLDLLADDTCLRDSADRCHVVDDDATEAATYLHDLPGPYEDIPAGASEPGVMVYAVPADAGGFSLGPRRR